MVQYRRYVTSNPDELFFFTLVTLSREQFFRSTSTANLVHDQFDDGFRYAGGEIHAWVIMPDHFHLLVAQGTRSFSDTIKRCKLHLNMKILNGKGSLWQPRFWEHKIRNDEDYRKHIDYIHFNPVRHGFCSQP
ncbi:MAG: transposase [Candidatus Electryonea clarkiae]|nr:transposase [Candidatus Electryonea clarkiae]MDP8288216.1 transposase [Candidatus Electryonea clarkiae]